MVFHGGGSTAAQMEKFTSWNEISNKNGFIVVYPEGIDKNWNDGRVNESLNGVALGDDVGFTSKIIDELVSKDKVNPKKVYVTGVSNGGFMSFKLACDLRDKISAIGVIVASVPTNYVQKCKPSKGIPIIWFNGTSDPLVPWEGGEMVSKTIGSSLSRGTVLSVQDSINFWKVINNCNSDPQITDLPNNNKFDGSTVTRQFYNSNSGFPIDFYKIDGGGHSWPGGPQYYPKIIIGNVNKDIDSLQLTWEFFSKY
jgi:polyhydroxybutyrate depolymerase